MNGTNGNGKKWERYAVAILVLLVSVLGWLGRDMRTDLQELRSEVTAIRREQDRRTTTVASVELLRQEVNQLRVIAEERARLLAVLESRLARFEMRNSGP